MYFNREVLYSWMTWLYPVALLALATLPGGADTCNSKQREVVAYSDTKIYSFPEPRNENSTYWELLENNNAHRCTILFESVDLKDLVKLYFDLVDLDSPQTEGDYSTCRERIVLYDGQTEDAPKMATICGGIIPIVQSKSNFLLLVYIRDLLNRGNDGSFKLYYESVERKSGRTKPMLPEDIMALIVLATTIVGVLVLGLVGKLAYRAYIKRWRDAHNERWRQRVLDRLTQQTDTDTARTQAMAALNRHRRDMTQLNSQGRNTGSDETSEAQRRLTSLAIYGYNGSQGRTNSSNGYLQPTCPDIEVLLAPHDSNSRNLSSHSSVLVPPPSRYDINQNPPRNRSDLQMPPPSYNDIEFSSLPPPSYEQALLGRSCEEK